MAATRSFPALGFDPAPGDADAVQKAADAFTSCGKAVSEAHDTASGLSVGTWTGQAAESASHQFGQLGQSIGDQNTALSGASKALGQWASDLKGFQSKAATLESEAEAAKQKLTTAQSSPDLKLAGQTFTNQAEGQAAQSKYQAATSGVKSAQSALDGIKQQAKTLLGQHDQAAQAVAKQLTAESTGLGKESPAQTDNSLGSKIAQLALANQGKGAGSCSQVSTPGAKTNSLGGNQFGTSCSGGGEYWCSDFAKWAWQNSGANVNGLSPAAGSFYTYGQQHNTVHTDAPKVGDAVVLNHNGGYADHVGIVTAVNPDGSFQTTNGDWNGQNGTEQQFAQTSSVTNETWKVSNGQIVNASTGAVVEPPSSDSGLSTGNYAFVSPASS